MKRNFKAETLNLAIADFNNRKAIFDLWNEEIVACDDCDDWWEEKYWNNHSGNYIVDENGICSCPEWFSNGFDNEEDYLVYLDGCANLKAKKALEKAKIDEIKATEIPFTGRMTKEFFERYVTMGVELDGWYGRYWKTMYLFEIDFYLSNLSDNEYLSDIDYSGRQEKPEIGEFLDKCINEWVHGHTGFSSLNDLIYSKFE